MLLLNNIERHLIFMDTTMPIIDGYQLCSLLRKNSKFKDIPIIILTAITGMVDRIKAKLVGATDYITKPFTQEDILRIVFRYLTD
ncbi:MAG TPA: response regulator [Geminocystis sp. M7585_C2015_104]|nr:response regulator [Geminocystis sp. M7585_C2015_104]